jgi:hypothetical protein
MVSAVGWTPIVVDGGDNELWLGDPADAVELDDAAAMLARLLEARPAWHARAACRGDGPATFFPEQGQSAGPARDVCAGCPVAAECAEAGLVEDFGVWGAMTTRERVQRRRSAPRRPIEPYCAECGEQFTATNTTATYCSRRCNMAAWRRKARKAG